MLPWKHLRATFAVGTSALSLAACSDATTSQGEHLGSQGSAISPISGCDYSFARPSPSSLVSMGYQFAARYLSGDPGGGKDITSAEASSLTAAGLDVVLVWETSGTDATDGYNQGVSDAQAAKSEAASVGEPDTRPIYFALDFDEDSSQAAAVDAYFQGVASVLGLSRTGAYGGYYAINQLFNAGLITFGWQTYAWSGGAWDSRAQLRQTQNGVDNDELDDDLGMVADYGQWGPGSPSSVPEYAAEYVSQSFPLAATALDMVEGQTIPSYIELKNVGSKTWDSSTHLGTTQPRDRTSVFADQTWLSPDRPAGVTGTVAPGQTFKFQFDLHAPSTTGTYFEYFGVVEDGVAWFSDPGQGGPPDNDLEVQVVVSAPEHTDGGAARKDAEADVDGGAVGADAGTPAEGGAPDHPRDAGPRRDSGRHDDASAGSTSGSEEAGADAGESNAASNAGGCRVAGGDRPSSAPFLVMGLALLARRRRALRRSTRL